MSRFQGGLTSVVSATAVIALVLDAMDCRIAAVLLISVAYVVGIISPVSGVTVFSSAQLDLICAVSVAVMGAHAGDAI